MKFSCIMEAVGNNNSSKNLLKYGKKKLRVTGGYLSCPPTVNPIYDKLE